MEKIVCFDKQGRLLIDDDPIEALSKLGKERLKGKSIEMLKKEVRREIEANQ